MTASKLRLCFVGPMLGRNEGWVTTQGELLADQFRADGWSVRETSHIPNRAIRLLDTMTCLFRWRKKVDIAVVSVFSGHAFVMADITSAVNRLLKVPTIFVLRGGNLPDFRRKHPRWVQRVLARATVVAPSQFLAEEMAAAVTGSMEVIPNLIDLTTLPFRRREVSTPKLLWVRTFHPIYNPAMALRALESIHSACPDAVLTMAGQEKGLTAALRSEAAERHLANAVTFAGFLAQDEKSEMFNRHDIYLHTNHVDNAPVSVLEAAAAGLPIVATNVSGIPYMLEHEQTALLVPDNDHEAMAVAIRRLLNEPDLTKRLSDNGRQLAEASAWPSVQQRWVELFQSLGRRAGANGPLVE